MPRPELYREISERYLSASDLLANDIHEAAGFTAYHAFESIGAAWIRKNGRLVPRGHNRKLNAFVNLCHGTAFAHSASYLATFVNALRNKTLYPVLNNVNNYETPQNTFTKNQIKDLNKRVKGFINKIKLEI